VLKSVIHEGFMIVKKQQIAHWQQIKKMWSDEYPWLWFTPGLTIGLLVGFLVGVSTATEIKGWFIDGFWPEGIGIFVTVVVIDSYAKKRAVEQEKRRLILQMGSPDNAFAVEAVRILRSEGWLADGSLNEAWLYKANLNGVELDEANLDMAVLSSANLHGAGLQYASLKEADLSDANLQKVDFSGANLRGAALYGSNLLDVAWENIFGTPPATLPDGSKWVEGRDMREFTYPDEWKAEQQAKV